VTNVTFIFETSSNTKPKDKNVGGTWHIIFPPSEKVGGHVPVSLTYLRSCSKQVGCVLCLLNHTNCYVWIRLKNLWLFVF